MFAHTFRFAALRFDSTALRSAFAPRKPRHPLLRFAFGLVGVALLAVLVVVSVFVGAAMIAAGLVCMLWKQRGKRRLRATRAWSTPSTASSQAAVSRDAQALAGHRPPSAGATAVRMSDVIAARRNAARPGARRCRGQSFPVRRIYCVGRNFADHAREMGAAVPASNAERGTPVFFLKPADADRHRRRRALSARHAATCTTKSNWSSRSAATRRPACSTRPTRRRWCSATASAWT